MKHASEHSGFSTFLFVAIITVLLGGFMLFVFVGMGAVFFLYASKAKTASTVVNNAQQQRPAPLVSPAPQATPRPSLAPQPVETLTPESPTQRTRSPEPPNVEPLPSVSEPPAGPPVEKNTPLTKVLSWKPSEFMGESSPVDLSDYVNVKIEEMPGLPAEGFEDAGVRFGKSTGVIQLAAKGYEQHPKEVVGINIAQHADRLYFAHATLSGSFQVPNHPKHEDDGRPVGEYVVHYEDGQTTRIPLLFGEAVRDWWAWDNRAETPFGKPIAGGLNESTQRFKIEVRYFISMWENPRPDLRIESIDFRSTHAKAAPFCLAITGVNIE